MGLVPLPLLVCEWKCGSRQAKNARARTKCNELTYYVRSTVYYVLYTHTMCLVFRITRAPTGSVGRGVLAVAPESPWPSSNGYGDQ